MTILWQNRVNPNSEMGNEIERTCRAPGAVGRVTPCAPRLQPMDTNFPRRRLPNPLPITAFHKCFLRYFPFYALKPHPTITQRIAADPRVVGRVTPCAPLLASNHRSFPPSSPSKLVLHT
jgi:hypothetical protein